MGRSRNRGRGMGRSSSRGIGRRLTSVLEKEQVMAEQRKTLTQSMTRKRTPKTTQSHRSQEGPRSQSPVDAGTGRSVYAQYKDP